DESSYKVGPATPAETLKAIKSSVAGKAADSMGWSSDMFKFLVRGTEVEDVVKEFWLMALAELQEYYANGCMPSVWYELLHHGNLSPLVRKKKPGKIRTAVAGSA